MKTFVALLLLALLALCASTQAQEAVDVATSFEGFVFTQLLDFELIPEVGTCMD